MGLLNVEGLVAGYSALGATSLSTIADVATCVAQRHACRSEEIGSTALPRLRPLLVAAGIDPSPFTCLASGASGDAGSGGVRDRRLDWRTRRGNRG